MAFDQIRVHPLDPRSPSSAESQRTRGFLYNPIMSTSDSNHPENGNSNPPPRSVWGFLFRDKLPLEKETCWFVLVNVLDFFATYVLLVEVEDSRETNPIANWFIDGWGPLRGMLAYKLSMVAFICIVVQLIALKRVDLARRVLWFGIIIVSGVVTYTLVLLLRTVG